MKKNMPRFAGSRAAGKICLYLEFYKFLDGAFYKNIGTGLLSSYKNQKKSLQTLGLDFAESWADDCDILQINTPWFWSLWLIKKARRQGKKIIIWAHVTAEDAREVFWFNKYFFPLIKKYLKYAYNQADIVFCPSAHTKSLLENYGLPAEKLVVQSNGVDGSRYYKDEQKREAARQKYTGTVIASHSSPPQMRRGPGGGADDLIVGTVGLVIPRKGVDIFVNLAKKHPANPFIWFGKIYSPLMAKGVPKNLPDNVAFTGFVDDVNAAFNALDIFVFLSSEENQGMVILEAAAVGLPILVKGLPAYEGWLIHNENCLIAKDNDEVEQYLNLLLADADLRARLIEGAKKLAKQEDIKVQNQKLLAVYNSLLS